MCKANILLISALLCFSSCSEEPGAVVSKVTNVTQNIGLETDQKISKKSITYVGTDFFGRQCTLSLTANDSEDESFFINLNYTIHGQAMPQLEGQFYKYELSSNTFLDVHGAQGNLAIAGAILNTDEEVNMNNLAEYETHSELVFSLRLDFQAGVDEHDFEHALEEILDDPSSFNSRKSELNVLQNATIKIAHSGHYDASVCTGFQANKVEEITYNLVEDHDHSDGDDHDDHDHD